MSSWRTHCASQVSHAFVPPLLAQARRREHPFECRRYRRRLLLHQLPQVGVRSQERSHSLGQQALPNANPSEYHRELLRAGNTECVWREDALCLTAACTALCPSPRLLFLLPSALISGRCPLPRYTTLRIDRIRHTALCIRITAGHSERIFLDGHPRFQLIPGDIGRDRFPEYLRRPRHNELAYEPVADHRRGCISDVGHGCFGP